MSILIVTPAGEASFLITPATQGLTPERLSDWIAAMRITLPVLPRKNHLT